LTLRTPNLRHGSRGCDVLGIPSLSRMNNCQCVGVNMRIAFMPQPWPMLNLTAVSLALNAPIGSKSKFAGAIEPLSHGQLICPIAVAGEQDLDQFRSGDFKLESIRTASRGQSLKGSAASSITTTTRLPARASRIPRTSFNLRWHAPGSRPGQGFPGRR